MHNSPPCSYRALAWENDQSIFYFAYLCGMAWLVYKDERYFRVPVTCCACDLWQTLVVVACHFNHLFQVAADSGNLQEAEQLYAQARKADPQNVSVLVHEALLTLQKTQDFDAASRQLQAALDLDPNSDFVYETMAQLEVQRHNIDRALELWDKALSLVRTRFEMMNLFSLREATRAQAKISKGLGIDLTALVPEVM